MRRAGRQGVPQGFGLLHQGLQQVVVACVVTVRELVAEPFGGGVTDPRENEDDTVASMGSTVRLTGWLNPLSDWTVTVKLPEFP